MAKTSGGKKMDSREIVLRYFERRFFALLFFPSFWFRPQAGLGLIRGRYFCPD